MQIQYDYDHRILSRVAKFSQILTFSPISSLEQQFPTSTYLIRQHSFYTYVRMIIQSWYVQFLYLIKHTKALLCLESPQLWAFYRTDRIIFDRTITQTVARFVYTLIIVDNCPIDNFLPIDNFSTLVKSRSLFF